MATDSKIGWTTHTWNPWQGCRKVSPGCKYCYMYRDKERYQQDPKDVHRSQHATFFKPLSWKDPALVFTCSWSDWFIEEADGAWRDTAWDIIKSTPHLTYQILTKRPERIAANLPDDWGSGYPNVWLGVSVEDQVRAMERLPILVRTPAAVRFVSAEPLLDAIDLRPWVPGEGWTAAENKWPVDWVILGGESGNENGKYKYRPCDPLWFYRVIGHCAEAGVPVFMKQLGTHLAKRMKLKHPHGAEPAEWPTTLQVQEWPLSYTPAAPAP